MAETEAALPPGAEASTQNNEDQVEQKDEDKEESKTTNGADQTKGEESEPEKPETQGEENASDGAGEAPKEEEATDENKYYTVSYRKIKKGLAKNRINIFEKMDFSMVEEEDNDDQEGKDTGGESQTNGEGENTNGESDPDGTNGQAGKDSAENQGGENTGEEAGEGQDKGNGGEKEGNEQNKKQAGENEGDEQEDVEMGDEEGEEDGFDENDINSASQQGNRPSASKFFTVSYRKIKKGITKQRVDEFEFMGHQPASPQIPPV